MEVFSYEINVSDGLMEQWHQAPQIVQEELTRGMQESLALLWRETADATPHKTGLLRGSIAASPVEIGVEQVTGFVGTPVSYAIPVELGTGPHLIKAKDGGVLHFMWNGHEVHVRSVHHPGTKPVRMFAGTMERKAPDVEEIFARARDRIAARLGLA